MKIEAIAAEVGYRTEAHFRQLFRRYTSQTPAGFRSKHTHSSIFLQRQLQP
jgi:transcriptional regulator GlxA family with amidase domain